MFFNYVLRILANIDKNNKLQTLLLIFYIDCTINNLIIIVV